MGNEKYILQVGDKTNDRLKLLNQIYNSFSLDFLKKHELRSGMTILDIGCGFGIMTCKLAELVGTSGYVIGIDNSAEQLEIAHQKASEKKIKNIKFIKLSVYDLECLDQKFDLVWGRFILSHLTEPEKVISKVYQQLHPEGIFCSDETFTPLFSYPEHILFDQFARAVSHLFEAQGKNFNLGMYVPAKLKAFGFNNIITKSSFPILFSASEKVFMSQSIIESKSAILETQALTETEYECMLNWFNTAVVDENCYFSAPGIIQTSGCKLKSR